MSVNLFIQQRFVSVLMRVGTLMDLAAEKWMWSDVSLETHRSLERETSRKPPFWEGASLSSPPWTKPLNTFPSQSPIVLFCSQAVLSMFTQLWASFLRACFCLLYKSPDWFWASILTSFFFSSKWISADPSAWETWIQYYQAYFSYPLPCWKSIICQFNCPEGLWSHLLEPLYPPVLTLTYTSVKASRLPFLHTLL